jgi:aspartate carbamoyltransferase catalytic subunit
MNHLCSIDDLTRTEITNVLDVAATFVGDDLKTVRKLTALQGKTVATLFFEDSTRTRMSFETAAKKLSADVMTLAVSSSSVNKGESLYDTVQTITALGVDAMVIRHKSSGVPLVVSTWTDAKVVNAGDGRHEHPTQALLDVFTLRQMRGNELDGLRVGIIGDIAHSRVARSNVKAMTKIGIDVTLIAPPTLFPIHTASWEPHRYTDDLDSVISELDVLYVLRLQRERQDQALLPSLHEYHTRYGITALRLSECKPDVIVMHPGPMNRGVEIDADIADGPQSVITQQVSNGVAVRMSVLHHLLIEPKG